jgi:hypothetical protein
MQARSSTMMTHEADTGRSPKTRPGHHRLLPIVGGGVAVAVVLAHLGGGALVMHVGLPAALVLLGLDGPLENFSGGALLIGIVPIAAMMLLLVFGARHWLQRR